MIRGAEGRGEKADLEALCSLPRHLSTTRPCSPGEKTRQPTPRTHLVSSGPSIRRSSSLLLYLYLSIFLSSPFSFIRLYIVVYLWYLIVFSFSLSLSLSSLSFSFFHLSISLRDCLSKIYQYAARQERFMKVLHLPSSLATRRCLSATAVN